MTIFTLWILSICLYIPIIAFNAWWAFRHDKFYELTLAEIFWFSLVAFIPFVNTLVTIIGIGLILFTIMPEVVILRKKS